MTSTGPLYAMGGAHPHALAALSEEAAGDAMQGLATGNRAGKRSDREQDIYTPDSVLEVCRAVWPAGIELDPCASLNCPPLAVRQHYGGEQGDGLTESWIDGVYFNPPYKDLKAWLAKSTKERAYANVVEQIGLFPVRPHRVWWCEYMRVVPTRIAWLKPLKFRYYKQAFPAPLVLVYTGSRTERFTTAVYDLACLITKELTS